MTEASWTARAMQKYAEGQSAAKTDDTGQNQRLSSVLAADSPSAFIANTTTTAPSPRSLGAYWARSRLRCLIAGCETPAADIAYCPRHRQMADDGTLWPQDDGEESDP